MPLYPNTNLVPYSLFAECIEDYAIFMMDLNGYILSWNQGAKNIKGYTHEEIIGKHFSIFYSAEDQATSKPHWELKVAKSEGKYGEEGWRIKKDGSTFWANVLITAIYDKKHCLKGFAKVTQDLSEKINTQKALLNIQQHNKELQKNTEEFNEFTQIIAHDFREPLRGISNFASILSDELEDRLNEEERHLLESLKRQAIRMSSLLDSVLKISLANYMQPNFTSTNLNIILEEVLELLSCLLKEKNIEIRIPCPLPTICCDALRIREVFNNLITNAAKYNNKENKWIEIGWSESITTNEKNFSNSAEEEKLITIYVRDNGIGIQEKDFPVIFKPLKRINAKGQYGEGTGIGLNLTKKIIERHKGKIWVESLIEEGTTFYFTISNSLLNKPEELENKKG